MSSPTSTRSTDSETSDIYANASVFKNRPYFKHEQYDDLSHGMTDKARRWSGSKKNPGEGRSHYEAHAVDGDQKTQTRAENKVSVKKNKDLSTMTKKNHRPEQAAKVFDADRRQST